MTYIWHVLEAMRARIDSASADDREYEDEGTPLSYILLLQ
jgi:hypothetical protein